jgi:hypothetical protein
MQNRTYSLDFVLKLGFITKNMNCLCLIYILVVFLSICMVAGGS